jgi:stage II sporulation protein M
VISFLFAPLLFLLPLTVLTLNGALLSFVAVAVAQQKSLGFVLAAILPHGVIELPAIIIGEAAALGFGAAVMGALVSARHREQLQPRVRQSLRYLVLSMIILVPAALLETFVTPIVAGR